MSTASRTDSQNPRISKTDLEPLKQKHEPSTTCQKVMVALAIIVGFGLLIAGIVGVCGYFQVGLLSTVKQIDAIILMAAGGIGLILGVVGIVGLKKICSSNKIITAPPPQENTNKNAREELEAAQAMAKQMAEEAVAAQAKLEADAKARKEKEEQAAQEAAAAKAKLEAAEKAKLEPLPPPLKPILSLQLAKDHPLEQPFQVIEFLKPSHNKQTYKPLLGKEPMSGAKNYESAFDAALLNLPLLDWVHPDLGSQWSKDTINAPAHKEHKALIDQRIELLDQAMGLKKRLRELATDNGVLGLTVWDALYLWSSPESCQLRLRCLQDSEIEMLTVASLDYLGHDHVFATLFNRIASLSGKQKTPHLPTQYTKESLATIPLVDLGQLPLGSIDPSLLAHIPPLTLGLVPVDELKKIKTTKLPATHWECLPHLSHPKTTYGCKKQLQLVRYFEPEQINDAIDQIKLCRRLLGQLSIKQISGLDPKKVDQTTLEAMFDVSNSTRCEKRLAKLPIDKIYAFSPHFSSTHWKFLGKKHTLAFDFDQIDESKRQEVFDILFTTNTYMRSYDTWQPARLFENFELPKIFKLSPFMTVGHWACIGTHNVLKLDFKIFTPDTLKLIVDKFFNGKNAPYGHLSWQLPLEQQAVIQPYLRKDA